MPTTGHARLPKRGFQLHVGITVSRIPGRPLSGENLSFLYGGPEPVAANRWAVFIQGQVLQTLASTGQTRVLMYEQASTGTGLHSGALAYTCELLLAHYGSGR
jgi:hypothetical protein